MEALAIGLTAFTIALVVILLAVMRAGIRRLDRADPLTCQPPGLAAALARRVVGLYAHLPATTDRCDHEHHAPPAVQDERPRTS
jgi:hypothetical protein